MDCPEAEGRVFNAGSQVEISIMALAEKVRDVTGSSSEIVTIPYDQAYEVGFEDMQRRRPDTTRIRTLIGWEPEFSLDRTIEDVADDVKARQGS
jgi:UDP-glucose 4-epimerase